AAQEFGTGDIGFGLGVSTLGVTGHASYEINPNMTVRAIAGGAPSLSETEDFNEPNLVGTFDGSIRIGGVGPIVDYHPFAGGLRVSAGAILSNYRVRADADGDITVDGNVVANAEARATVRTRNRVMPKLAVGYDSSRAFGTMLGVSVDAGLMYNNGFRTRVTSGDLTAAERRTVRDEINEQIDDAFSGIPGRGRVLPYVSVNVGLRF
ncbi:MAG: hypothetical protein EA386_11780, partial [Rhodobacteraceae bacterium]